MQDNRIKDTFNNLNPTQEQSEDMWQKIEAASKEHGKVARSKGKPIKYVAAAGLVVGVLTASGFGINAATDGKVQEVITKVFHPNSAQSLENT